MTKVIRYKICRGCGKPFQCKVMEDYDGKNKMCSKIRNITDRKACFCEECLRNSSFGCPKDIGDCENTDMAFVFR